MKRFLRTLVFGVAIALWCMSFYLLLSSHPYVGDIPAPKYGLHALMFFGLAFMTTCAQQRPKIVLTLAALYIFGGMTEVAQHFLPPRTCDPLDFLEDVVGATLGLVVALAWMALLRRFLRVMRVFNRDKMQVQPLKT
jgi:hypothetical protein